jgi:excisionase family DNA binding protein
MTIRVVKMAEQEKEIEWIEPAQAAEIMGVALRTVQNLCANGDLNCRKWGRSWMVDKSAAEAYEKGVGGRPKKVS